MRPLWHRRNNVEDAIPIVVACIMNLSHVSSSFLAVLLAQPEADKMFGPDSGQYVPQGSNGGWTLEMECLALTVAFLFLRSRKVVTVHQLVDKAFMFGKLFCAVRNTSQGGIVGAALVVWSFAAYSFARGAASLQGIPIPLSTHAFLVVSSSSCHVA